MTCLHERPNALVGILAPFRFCLRRIFNARRVHLRIEKVSVSVLDTFKLSKYSGCTWSMFTYSGGSWSMFTYSGGSWSMFTYSVSVHVFSKLLIIKFAFESSIVSLNCRGGL
jgi:hypothetical protein